MALAISIDRDSTLDTYLPRSIIHCDTPTYSKYYEPSESELIDDPRQVQLLAFGRFSSANACRRPREHFETRVLVLQGMRAQWTLTHSNGQAVIMSGQIVHR